MLDESDRLAPCVLGVRLWSSITGIGDFWTSPRVSVCCTERVVLPTTRITFRSPLPCLASPSGTRAYVLAGRRRNFGYPAAQDALFAPCDADAGEGSPGSPSRRSKTAGESTSGPRVASGRGASAVFSDLEEETRVPSSKPSDFLVGPVPCDPVSLLQDAISKRKDERSRHQKHRGRTLVKIAHLPDFIRRNAKFRRSRAARTAHPVSSAPHQHPHRASRA